jgi:hypothetical protein
MAERQQEESVSKCHWKQKLTMCRKVGMNEMKKENEERIMKVRQSIVAL